MKPPPSTSSAAWRLGASLAPGAFRAVFRSLAIRTAVAYGLSGVAFSGANLVLARLLSYEDYALLALLVAVLNVAVPLAPLGADGIMNRRRLRATPRLLRHVVATAAVVALLATVVSAASYDLPRAVLPFVGIGVLAGGINYLASAYFQSRQRLGVALALALGVNGVLLAASLVTMLPTLRTLWTSLALLVAGYVVAATIGWSYALRHASVAPDEEDDAPSADRPVLGEERVDAPFPWGEALSLVGLSTASLLLGQLERFVIPKVLDLRALATFGVLAATVGAVFRVLLLGVGYSLVPRLRATFDVAARRRLILEEGIVVAIVVAAGCAAVWLVTPWLVAAFFDGKYVLPQSLILGTILTGLVKVAGSFARAVVSAIGTARELRQLSVFLWLAAALSVVGATIGARWGLTGVIYGVGLGWLAQAIAAMVLARPHLRDRA